MPVVPPSDLAAIQFCESHLPGWSLAPASVGLSALQCNTLLAQAQASRASYVAARSARLAARAATTTFQSNSKIMRGTVADMVRLVKAFADASANPAAIYAASQIPQPAAPTPPAPPAMPTSIVVGLNPGGSITLRWKARDASPSTGCVFVVSRQLAGAGGYTVVGSGISVRGGKYQFTDHSIPAGIGEASYIIVGTRSNPRQTGTPSAAISVQLGTPGMIVASDARAGGLKMAA